jgi:hypothetical protein
MDYVVVTWPRTLTLPKDAAETGFVGQVEPFLVE